MPMIESAMAVLASIAAAIFSGFGVHVQTEQPRYQVLARIGPAIEIRNYLPRVAAETTIDAANSENGSTTDDAVASRAVAIGPSTASIVTTDLPATSEQVWQDRTAWPSIKTVHAPQSPAPQLIPPL